MASKRVTIELKSTESPHSYTTTINPRTQINKIETRKFDPLLRRHCVYKQKKVHKGK